MRRKVRSVPLFLDNAPSHPRLTLKNVKLQFLPPNTASRTQPMDQGIIQAVKLKYRKRQLQHIIASMGRYPDMTGSQLLKHISICDAIYWVNRAWRELDTHTVEKCFRVGGFGGEMVKPVLASTENSDGDAEDNVALEVFRIRRGTSLGTV